MVIVGGSGYFFGPFLGAVVAVLLPEWLQSADKMYDALGPLGEALRTVLPPEALKYVSKHYLVVYALFVICFRHFQAVALLARQSTLVANSWPHHPSVVASRRQPEGRRTPLSLHPTCSKSQIAR